MLKGKVAIVTGGSLGIGYAIAERLAADGASVVICARKQQGVDEAVSSMSSKGLRVAGVAANVSVEEDRKKLIEFTKQTFGEPDILVNNVAVNPYFGSILDMPAGVYEKVMDTNVKAPLSLTLDVARSMRSRGAGGTIVFIASILGFAPGENLGVYSLSKTSLVGLTKVLSGELAPHNIRVNCVAPGIIETRFSEVLWKKEKSGTENQAKIPLRRFGKPEDISPLVSFLASDAHSGYMTGETILVTGGMTSRL
eukprot:TRINITY_DN17788_c0_g1_i1.p1 TRINITY_DN17788_c0_g1~~TRINITY_DN17788_c0_g1_i1.p1  ORF type:complete len:253 (+),score=56.95 TRINITY_DN17788_c0_g1_i1:8-766(+)